MDKGRNRILEFVINTFFIAVAFNTIVAVSVIHYNTNNTFALLPQTFIFIAGISIACFLSVCFFILLIAWSNAKKNPEKIFWIIMGFGVIGTGLQFTLLRDLFGKYSDWTEVFSVIAIFSIMVSITSQYQLFIGGDATANNVEEPVSNSSKTFGTDDAILGKR